MGGVLCNPLKRDRIDGPQVGDPHPRNLRFGGHRKRGATSNLEDPHHRTVDGELQDESGRVP